MNQRLSDIWKFITYDIWRITESEVTRTKFSIYNIIKTIYLCVNRFNKDRIVNKASALTYSTPARHCAHTRHRLCHRARIRGLHFDGKPVS